MENCKLIKWGNIMKKHLSLLLVLVVGSCLMAQTPVQPSGAGTEGDPYQVVTLSNLLWVASTGGYAVQQNDIDASATSTWFPDGSGGYFGWPLVTYSGNYNGQGYEISGLYINRPGSNSVGLFGYAMGPVGSTHEISNVRLTNANITGNQDVGGIVGLSVKYNISKCSSDGSVSGSVQVGGIAGRYRAEYGIPVLMSECYSTAVISGDVALGGLIGFTEGVTNGIVNVNNSYADASIITAAGGGGGLVGIIVQSVVFNCYSRGAVQGIDVGGLIGGSDAGGEGGSTVTSSYWDQDSSGQASSPGGGIGYPTFLMKIQEAYSGWDFTSTWSIDGSINDGYPYLQTNLPEDALPITLTDFSAKVNHGAVVLSWNTASETDNAYFLIYRNGEVIARLEGAGTSSEPHNYSYSDTQVVPGNTYSYVLADVSYANDIVLHENDAVSVTIDESVFAEEFVLEANYPNPFNPITAIPYALPTEGYVKLSIYDISGQLVCTLVDGVQSAGFHKISWDGRNNSGSEVNSGMYISKIIAGDFSQSRKMLLVK
jgi:FlgD Ig-like domain